MLLKPSKVVPQTFFVIFMDEDGIEEEQEELTELSSFQNMWTESQVSESNALQVLL